MPATLSPDTTPAGLGTGRHPDIVADAAAYSRSTRLDRARWPFFGALAGVTAFAATMVSIPAIDEADRASGLDVVAKLESGGYRIGFVLGLVSVGALLAAAAGWRRWAETRAPRDLAARTVGQGLSLTAAVNVVFYGFTGTLGLYLPGGAEEGGMSTEGLFATHTMLEFGSLLGWWGAAVSALGVTSLAFRKARLLPRWMGVVSVVLLLPALLMALLMSLPGFAGLSLPLWLTVVSVGMVRSRVADAAA